LCLCVATREGLALCLDPVRSGFAQQVRKEARERQRGIGSRCAQHIVNRLVDPQRLFARAHRRLEFGQSRAVHGNPVQGVGATVRIALGECDCRGFFRAFPPRAMVPDLPAVLRLRHQAGERIGHAGAGRVVAGNVVSRVRAHVERTSNGRILQRDTYDMAIARCECPGNAGLRDGYRQNLALA
jgi:hypothetical protein